MSRILEEYLQNVRRNVRSVNAVREEVRELSKLNSYACGRPADPTSIRYFNVFFYGISPLWVSLCILEPIPEILVRNAYNGIKKLTE